ncbi:2'-5' RNA ligase family protein [Streptacidiphilus sp. PAMC 29251]
MPSLAHHPGTFPPHPPADYDDPAAILSTDQRAFDQLDQTKNHWDRTGWTRETRVVYWLLTFNGNSELADSARTLQHALARTSLDLIRPADLHLTLTRAGRRSDITEQQIDALAEKAEGRLGPPFTLTAHPLTGSAGAVRYSVVPWTPLIALHTALTRFQEELGLPGGKPTERFRPHLGLAYSKTVQAAQPLIDAVSSLRSHPPVTLDITHVDLVELRREPGRYTWDRFHCLPLT